MDRRGPALKLCPACDQISFVRGDGHDVSRCKQQVAGKTCGSRRVHAITLENLNARLALEKARIPLLEEELADLRSQLEDLQAWRAQLEAKRARWRQRKAGTISSSTGTRSSPTIVSRTRTRPQLDEEELVKQIRARVRTRAFEGRGIPIRWAQDLAKRRWHVKLEYEDAARIVERALEPEDPWAS